MSIDLVTVLSIASQVATVIASAYGLLWLERYRKQKIIEHQSDNARQALDQLVIIEECMDHLFAATGGEKKEILHVILPKALRAMYKELLLLQQIHGIPDKLHLIERLSDVDINTSRAVQSDVTIDMLKQIFMAGGGYKQQCAELKEQLVRIYILRA